ncbi:transcriptional regulator [Methanosarcinales archaeon ex4484_138]|nr:MAG: transcriptional regulator [Methanosarcinales archaeon ex4484_138]RLG26613.1 MAG: nickel-dependent lactate racemase [Methanosarcinales archaeon]
MRISLPMGTGMVSAEFSGDVQTILPKEIGWGDRDSDSEVLLESALRSPVGSKRLCDLVGSGESVAVLVSDITRPVPSRRLLTHLFSELLVAGVERDALIVFGLGLHRSMSEEERREILVEHYRRRHVEHDRERCTYLGETSQGTPVEIFSRVAECDRIVCTGNIDFHYYAGYTGGAKALLPGVSSTQSIIKNHSLMLDETSVAGRIDGAVRRDIDEAGRIAGVDFTFDVVLDSEKRIVHAACGDMVRAHREGVRVVDEMYKIGVEPADVVIVSPGGMPKDINLYQAHKALENVKDAVRDGGAIILVAACPEGYGNATFESWLDRCVRPEDAIALFHEDFVMGGHKAALIAKLSLEKDLYLVSGKNRDFADKAYFKHAPTLQNALSRAIGDRKQAQILIVPYGGTTLLST